MTFPSFRTHAEHPNEQARHGHEYCMSTLYAGHKWERQVIHNIYGDRILGELFYWAELVSCGE